MTFTTLLSIALGIGLAASTGFRIFLPLFGLSLAAYFGLWPVNENFQWLASTPALVIDDKLVSVGKVLSSAEVAALLKA